MTDKERIKELEKKINKLEKQLANSRKDNDIYNHVVAELLIFLKQRRDLIDTLLPTLENDRKYIDACLTSIGLNNV